MKKIIINILYIVAVLTVFSCSKSAFELDYKAPLSISFTGVDNSNVLVVGKGVTNTTVTINVNAKDAVIAKFEIYSADVTTGNKGSLISSSSVDSTNTYTIDYSFTGLTDNQCIKVIVTDIEGNTFEHNLLVKITPAVIFSQSVKIETAENYYGPYFASWLNGRVYMRSDGEAYKNEIDFSLGDAVIVSGSNAVPALINPAKRADYGLLTLSGLKDTKFAQTALTATDFNNISKVDATVINNQADPTLDAVKLVSGGVYFFKTSDGKKGFINISSLAAKISTIETQPNVWIENTAYSLVTLSTKVATK